MILDSIAARAERASSNSCDLSRSAIISPRPRARRKIRKQSFQGKEANVFSGTVIRYTANIFSSNTATARIEWHENGTATLLISRGTRLTIRV
jgi:hypothetical protein